MHSLLRKTLGIKHIYVCPHDDEDSCHCRKPKDGLIRRAVRELNLDIELSFLVGDRWKDIEAGQSAGCTCIFLDRGYTEKRPAGKFIRVQSLEQAVECILSL
jgi:D-glycero-D-manno-heptose 1,7-bisphosphate phosphatase